MRAGGSLKDVDYFRTAGVITCAFAGIFMAQRLTIGRLAKVAGVNVETIRYYQRRGLLQEPDRPAGGQRHYPESALHALSFVRRGQELGFTLAEIKDLLRLAPDDSARERVREIARSRYARMRLQVDELSRMGRSLKTLLGRSSRHRGSGPDPIIAALSGREQAVL